MADAQAATETASAAHSYPTGSTSQETIDFSTCEISDALLKLGVKNGGYIPGIEMYSPGLSMNNDAGCFLLSGPAFTVRIVDAERSDAPKMERHFVDQIEEGSVVVIEAPKHLKNAIWGGLMTAGAQARGARGVIISGRCRDLAEQRAAKFPVFARGHSTVGSSPFTRATNVQVPIQIEPNHEPEDDRAEGSGKVFPGVTIRPGDWVVADVDGVVCIPRQLMERTKELAAEGRAIDAHCLEDIRAGKGVAEAFRKWRGK